MAREIYQKWAEEASNDFTAGVVLHDAKIYNTAVFHFQQAVEKMVKACLYYYNEQPWGHSIFKLLQQLPKNNFPDLEFLINESREFDMHYTSTRYPDSLPGISPSELYNEETSHRMMKKAEQLIKILQNKMDESKTDSN